MPKSSAKSKREVTDSDTSDSGPDDARPAKKSRPSTEKTEKTTSGAKDSSEMVNGEPTWTIGPKRFVKIRTFKGKQYVDVREFWEDKDGQLKPGKKGISMNMEQWDMFTQIVDEVTHRL